MMRKSLFYTLFGFGKLPRKMRPTLEGEGIVLFDEGVRGSVTLRNFRSPTRISNYRRSIFVGSLVVTELRFAAFTCSRPIIDVGVNDEHLALLEVTVPREGRLCVKFDAAAFHEGWRGSIECRFWTSRARAILDRLSAQLK